MRLRELSDSGRSRVAFPGFSRERMVMMCATVTAKNFPKLINDRNILIKEGQRILSKASFVFF